MDGPEASRLRKHCGMSQAEFGAAIGVSRETVGRIERSNEHLDRRTELAMRYVAEGRLALIPELPEIHNAVAILLDRTAVRGSPPYDYRDKLLAAASNWRAKQGNTGAEPLLAQAQGLLGMLNVTPPGDEMRDRTFEQLRRLKLDWQAVKPLD
ncbi:helix-turn-helix domain-containing protein [Mesorhizobium sp. M2A.F.Ca.ET.042.01.1.1]|uniref:helix-turn-helix transcriptional regulator n=1 Tax=Mesorhizobium sp. M2A.F.Ca.ET.042.01.1.1 TaxID=2496745 RepID=UPI000FCC7FA3|nr:helix-turn-helix domain-containing protein [Mesorhizobium sp. M2A.F.Ca.ET.042.01.1.1]RUX32410.1 helix-turn-helix domain-containing protein [Mesorhizobium sp. M2A.F.Ca.ET.042.01.1.1]